MARMFPVFLRSSSITERSRVPRSHPNIPRSSAPSGSDAANESDIDSLARPEYRSNILPLISYCLPRPLFARYVFRCVPFHPLHCQPPLAAGEKFRGGKAIIGVPYRLKQRLLIIGVHRGPLPAA